MHEYVGQIAAAQRDRQSAAGLVAVDPQWFEIERQHSRGIMQGCLAQLSLPQSFRGAGFVGADVEALP